MSETKLAVMKGQMAHFKEALEEFALRHKADIRSNPEFRRGWLFLVCCRASWPCPCCLPGSVGPGAALPCCLP